MLPLLAGCSSAPDSINPVTWWHDAQGGEIAKQRPPPPGANAPYPNLATIPPKPAAPDQKELAQITQGLVADRAHAEYLATAAPLPDPSSPSASPSLFGQGTMPPPPPPGQTPAASATLPAAPGPSPTSAPGAAHAASGGSGVPNGGIAPPPSAAPRHPVQSAPLAPLPRAADATPSAASPATAKTAGPMAAGGSASPGAPAATAPPTAASKAAAIAAMPPSAAVASQAASAAAPLPAAPPAPPRLSGPGAPAMAPAMVASAAPAAPPRQANAIPVEFVPGSARLPPGAADILKSVAARRGKAVIAVTGYGEASSDDPSVQSAALSLGLSRAQAVANVLTGDGVPSSDVRVGAEAAGRGASVSLVQ